jgi:transposase
MIPKLDELKPYTNDPKMAAKKFEVSERTIKRWLTFYKLYEPKNSQPNKLNKAKANIIRDLDIQGYTQKELAKMFNVSQANIGRIINNIYYKTHIHLKGSAIVKWQ